MNSRRHTNFLILITVILLATSSAWLLYMVSSPEQAARVRNALISSAGERSDFEWSADEAPGGYLLERREAPEQFKRIARDLFKGRDQYQGGFQRALLIVEHLDENSGRGTPIQSSTEEAYNTIIKKGTGYCADYTQVFIGIALAADIPVREWGMSFKDFGAGHAVNEIYDSELGKWIFIDSFNSFYLRDRSTGEPLSVLELYDYLRADAGSEDADIEVIPIKTDKFRFKSPEAALKYLEQGKDQLFLWWGNNVFSYDRHPLVKMGAGVSRTLEQSAAIVSGIQPGIRILRTASNSEAIDELKRTRLAVGSALIISILSIPVLVILLIRNMRRRR